MEGSHTTQDQKKRKRKFYLKYERTEIDNFFFQKRHVEDQHVSKKMLNITNHQGNANENHNEILPPTF